MYLYELNWDNVPADVSVLIDENDQELNFVKNLREYPSPPCKYEGDECDVSGKVFSDNEGWYSNWSLLERPAKQQEAYPDSACPIAEWLMKLGYVAASDRTIAGVDVNLKTKEVFICTEFGDIVGIDGVIDTVNHKYSLLIKKEADKRKAELEAKRLKVLQELSDIDQELGLYNT